MQHCSDGFTTPTAPHLSTSSDKTPLSSQRPSNSSISYAGDEELSLQSANDLDIPPHSSSSSSSATSTQQHSPATVRTAPLYISVYTSTPPIPLVKGIVASSAPPTNGDDELFFTRRSPSPHTSSVLKKTEQSNTTTSPSVYKYLHHPSSQQKQQK